MVTKHHPSTRVELDNGFYFRWFSYVPEYDGRRIFIGKLFKDGKATGFSTCRHSGNEMEGELRREAERLMHR